MSEHDPAFERYASEAKEIKLKLSLSPYDEIYRSKLQSLCNCHAHSLLKMKK